MPADYQNLNTTLIQTLKKKIAALKESEEKFETIFESIPDGVLLADISTMKFSFGNKAILHMLGYTANEIEKLSVNDIHPKKDLPYVRQVFEKQARKDMGIAPGLPVKRKDGSVFYADINSFPLVLNGKKYLAGVFRDMTEIKKAEEALKESEAKYRMLLENLPQKIFFKDKNSIYISCNENYAADLKIKPNQIAGKTDFDFYPKNLAEKYRADDRKFMGSGKIVAIDEEYVKDGKKFFVHTVKTPIKDAKGKITGVLGIFWDVTKQKKAENKLKETQKKYEKEINELKRKLKARRRL